MAADPSRLFPTPHLSLEIHFVAVMIVQVSDRLSVNAWAVVLLRSDPCSRLCPHAQNQSGELSQRKKGHPKKMTVRIAAEVERRKTWNDHGLVLYCC